MQALRDAERRNANHHILEKEGKQQKYYHDVKRISNKTNSLENIVKGGCPAMSFFQKCKEKQIVPHPTFAKVKTQNGRLILSNYLISEEMALSLE